MKKIKTFILSTLLHYANRDIPFLSKPEFYQIKNRLLKKYGKKVDTQIQHIEHECWTCNGTGVFTCSWKLPEACWSCMGSGKYTEHWTELDVYQFGRYKFHQPVGIMSMKSIAEKKATQTIIEGKIYHKQPKYRIGKECALWLYLLYDRKTFKLEMKRYGYPSGRYTPLVIIGNMIFEKNKAVSIRRGNRFFKRNKKELMADDLPF